MPTVIILAGRTPNKMGWLARCLYLELTSAGWTVKSIFGNFSEYRNLENACKNLGQAESLINAVGFTGVKSISDCHENDGETFWSNWRVANNASLVCRIKNLPLIQLSTGCVFDGWNKNAVIYTEQDELKTQCYYSETKAKAENSIKQNCGKHFILRIHYPFNGDRNNRNIIHRLGGFSELSTLPQSMTSVKDLARFILHLRQFFNDDKAYGIYHVVNSPPLSVAEVGEMYKIYVDPKFQIVCTDKIIRPTIVLANKKAADRLGFVFNDSRKEVILALQKYNILP